MGLKKKNIYTILMHFSFGAPVLCVCIKKFYSLPKSTLFFSGAPTLILYQRMSMNCCIWADACGCDLQNLCKGNVSMTTDSYMHTYIYKNNTSNSNNNNNIPTYVSFNNKMKWIKKKPNNSEQQQIRVKKH